MVSLHSAYFALKYRGQKALGNPYVSSWENYGTAIAAYFVACHNETISRLRERVPDAVAMPHPTLATFAKDFGSPLWPIAKPMHNELAAPPTYLFPWWLGCEKVHDSHKAFLHAMRPASYPDFKPEHDAAEKLPRPKTVTGCWDLPSGGKFPQPLLPSRHNVDDYENYLCPWIVRRGEVEVLDDPVPAIYKPLELSL